MEKEQQEAQREVIEVEGISNFQRIVSGDINEGMLRWKGIEATDMLAKSTYLFSKRWSSINFKS